MTHIFPLNPARRRFIAGGAALLAYQALPLPALAGGPRKINLRAAPAQAPILGADAPPADVWAYGGAVPGPELRFRRNETVQIAFKNALPDETTVHWHGLRVPNAMDGVPGLTQPPVPTGGTFTYTFASPDAGTFWYHPHVRSSEQLARGLYGPLIVEEDAPPRVDRDITWVIDDWRVGRDGKPSQEFGHAMDMSHAGRLGNVATLNGRDSREFQVRAGERLRLRLLNTANARIFALRFEDHHPHVIAIDGHPAAPHAPVGGLIVLGPGQRADVILDLSGKPGQRAAVVDGYNRRNTYKFLDLVYGPEKPLRESPLNAPARLAANPVARPDLSGAQRHKVTITGGAMGGAMRAAYKGREMDLQELAGLGKFWAINGVVAHARVTEPLYRFQRGRTQVLEFENRTAWPHPMHLHGHAFQIFRRDGKDVPAPFWTDTVLLAPRETVEAAFVADNPGKWLFHCHILEHHAAGMACVAEVA